MSSSFIGTYVREKKKEKEKYDTVGGRRRADLIDSN